MLSMLHNTMWTILRARLPVRRKGAPAGDHLLFLCWGCASAVNVSSAQLTPFDFRPLLRNALSNTVQTRHHRRRHSVTGAIVGVELAAARNYVVVRAL